MMLYNIPKKFYYCVAFIVINFNIGLSQSVPPSPCPQYFKYYLNSQNEIYGYITVDAPSIGERITLDVHISFAGGLPTKDIGSINLIGTKYELASQAMNNEPFNYEVIFPVGVPIPTLTQITRNNVTICSGSPVQARLKTTIPYHHYATITFPTSSIQPEDSHIPVALPPTVTFPIEDSNIYVPRIQADKQCGVITSVTKLVFHGTDIEVGSWPWLAAIYKKNEFSCGGNLLSRTVVLTAAHCFTKETYISEINHYSIHLGRHNLNNQNEQYVSEKCGYIGIHENYKFNKSADADIAIVILERPIDYSENIKPICLWSGNIDQNLIVDQDGWLAGWGLTENNTSPPTPKRATQKVVRHSMCLWSNILFQPITSNRTFCAGNQNRSGPCLGDSGGGFVMLENESWVLRGIVASSLTNNIVCDTSNYAVYSDIAQFLPWIKKFL